MRIINKSGLWVHTCGCVLRKDKLAWSIKEYCKQHSPNFQKKADKLIRRKDKKRGTGWTKPDKKKK